MVSFAKKFALLSPTLLGQEQIEIHKFANEREPRKVEQLVQERIILPKIMNPLANCNSPLGPTHGPWTTHQAEMPELVAADQHVRENASVFDSEETASSWSL